MKPDQINVTELRNLTDEDPSLRILIVEDNPGDVILITEYLKSSGLNFTLTHAEDLRKMSEICHNNEFDVLLLDLGLPGSTGLDTLRQVKDLRINTTIVVMTGLDDEDTALASLHEGAQDYLVKNKLNPDNILRSIKYGIERKKIQDLLRKHTRQFSLLSSATGMVTRLEDISSIYKITCDNIRLLLGTADIIVVEFKDSGEVYMSCLEWLQPWADKIEEISGIIVNNPELKSIRLNNESIHFFNDGTLHEINDGIYEFLSGKVDRDDCLRLEKLIGIKNIYVVGFTKGPKIYGGAVIFSSQPINDDDKNIIETISAQASLSVHKRVIEKELRLSEFRYRKLNKVLEDKVKDRTADLESANVKLQRELKRRTRAQESLRKREAQLKELNATKDKFFNIVAHDLKNPFTSLLGSSELLFENIEQMEVNQIKELASILNDSAKGGFTILQNLLDWSRSQTGQIQMNYQDINLKDLINENISSLQLTASNKSICIKYESGKDIFVFADKNMVNTVLRNLLSNALKFTRRGGSVCVHTEITSSEVLITVKDSGIGIPKEKIDLLFRIDSTHTMPGTEMEQGTGLGLKLSREFTEKMNGRLWVESIENQGSEFKFAIPLKTK